MFVPLVACHIGFSFALLFCALANRLDSLTCALLRSRLMHAAVTCIRSPLTVSLTFLWSHSQCVNFPRNSLCILTQSRDNAIVTLHLANCTSLAHCSSLRHLSVTVSIGFNSRLWIESRAFTCPRDSCLPPSRVSSLHFLCSADALALTLSLSHNSIRCCTVTQLIEELTQIGSGFDLAVRRAESSS